jgi:hypothetical protein
LRLRNLTISQNENPPALRGERIRSHPDLHLTR